MRCSQCGGTKFEEDPARGDMLCAECGTVESENALASAVEYVENPGGTATAIGNFVSAESMSSLTYKVCEVCFGISILGRIVVSN